jgi:predicted PurR-regulated permease PerM
MKESASKPEQEMPAWVPSLLGRIVLTVLITLGTLWVIQSLSTLLINGFTALFLSFAFEPAVAFLAQRGWKRGVATAFVFLVALAAAVGFFAIMLPPILGQGAALFDRIPGWIEQYGPEVASALGIELSLDAIAANFGDLGSLLSRYAATVTGQVAGVASATVSVFVNMVTVALFTYYLVADGPKLRRKLFSVLRPERQAEVARIWELAIEKTGGYVYSRLLLATVSAIFTSIALIIIGVPDAIALGIWVGVISQFIPAVGTYIASVVPLFVAFVDEPIKAVWVLIVLVGYQQVENVLIGPRINARIMSLHPAIGFAAAIAGITLGGALGAIVALPTAAIIQAFVSAYLEEHPVETSRLVSDEMSDDVDPALAEDS